MSSTPPSSGVPVPSRRSFVARAAAAIVAGFGAGHLFRLPGRSTPAREQGVTVRPHPRAVPRTSVRPSSHE